MKCGRKISKFIDIMNIRTRMVNRFTNTSPCMYTVENIRTFAEIKRTVHENSMPIGSAINVNTTGVLYIDIKFHSSKKICCIFTTLIVGISIIISVSHRNVLAVEKIWRL